MRKGTEEQAATCFKLPLLQLKTSSPTRYSSSINNRADAGSTSNPQTLDPQRPGSFPQLGEMLARGMFFSILFCFVIVNTGEAAKEALLPESVAPVSPGPIPK